MKAKMFIVLALLGALLVACQGPFRVAGESSSDGSGPPVPIAGGTSTAASGGCAPEPTLRLWSPPDAISPEVAAEFGALHGIEVREAHYASDEAMLAGVRAGNSGYDLVFPSNEAAAQMIEGRLLRELERDTIPNAARLDANLVGLPHDPENRYTLPYQWGVVGIAYDAALFGAPPASWAQLLTFEGTAHGLAFSMLDDGRATIGAAQQSLGYSVNDTDPAHLDQARTVLYGQQSFSNFAGYDSEGVRQALADGTLPLAHARSTDAAQAARQNENLRFLVPEEGGLLWQRNLAIPADAPNPCAAELFMNYLLQPQVAAETIQYTLHNSPVPAARLLLDPITEEIMARGFVPDAETWERLEWMEPRENAAAWDTLWAELKAQQPASE